MRGGDGGLCHVTPLGPGGTTARPRDAARAGSLREDPMTRRLAPLVLEESGRPPSIEELRTGDGHPLPAPLAVRPWHPIRVWVEPDRQGTTLLQGFVKGRPVPGLVARRDGSAHAPKLPGWTHEMNAPSPLRNKVRDQHSIRVENTASRINAGVS